MTAEGEKRPRDFALLFDVDALSGDAAARDVLTQLEAVEGALRELGHVAVRIPVDLDLKKFKRRMLGMRPGLAFNLVESLDRSDRLQAVVPMLLEDWRLPFTGSGSVAMLASNDKVASKRVLAQRKLPFPACAWLERGELRFMPDGPEADPSRFDWIVKTRDSHASLFLDDDSIVRRPDEGALAERLVGAEAAYGAAFFAEQYIEGREFNLSVIEDAGGIPRVLPAAEISFAGMPAGKPHIVGYAAKWEEESAEHKGTQRVFPNGADDAVVIAAMADMARSAWKAFGLGGYARIDFRVDGAGNPFILEANANPCLSPDAGLAAAAEQAALGYTGLINGIVAAGLRRTSHAEGEQTIQQR